MAKAKNTVPGIGNAFDKDKQSDEQKKRVLWVNEQWTDHPFVKVWFGKFQEWIEWVYGNQYTIYQESKKKLVNIEKSITEGPLKTRDVANVYNRILPMVRQIWSEIRYPHEFYVIPNTGEGEDIKGAHLGSDIVEFTNDRGQFNLKINRAKLWLIITGTIYWKEWWNKNLIGLAKGSTKNVETRIGDVDFNYVIPFNCRPDVGLIRNGWRYFIEGKMVPQSTLEAEFKLPKGTLPPIGEEERRKGLFEGETSKESKEPQCLRIECHEVPNFSDGHEEGRFLVTCGDWLLWDKVNNTPDNELSYFQLPGLLPRLNEPVYDSAVRIAQPAQRQFNRMNSLVDEQVENFRLKGMYPRGSMLEGDLNIWKRVGVDFVEYNPRVGQPNWQNPPPVSKDILERLTSMEREIDASVSVRDPSYGRIPQYGTRASGKLFEQILGQDTAVLTPNVEDMDEELRPIVKHRLKLVQKHYKEGRLVKTVGRNKRVNIKYFKSADLRDNTDVRVKPGIDLLRNKKRKEEIVFAFIEKGVIQDPKEALEFLDNRTLEDYMEDQFIDERQAHRYLEIMKEQETKIAVEEEDNPDVHYRIFNNFRKTEEFESLPEPNQKNIEARIRELSERLKVAEQPTATGGGAGGGGELPLAATGPVESEAPVGMAGGGGGLTPEDQELLAQILAKKIQRGEM